MGAMGTGAIVSLAFSAVGTVVGTVGAMQQAQAQKDQANFQAAVARNNQIIANQNADAIVEQGKQDKADHRRKIKLAMGKVAPAQAAKGFLVDDTADSTNVGFRADLAEMGELDILRLGHATKLKERNARIQATNFGAQASLYDFQASQANPLLSGATSLISGIGGMASSGFASSGNNKGSIFFTG